LHGVLDGQDLVVWLKTEGLLSMSSWRLDEDLEKSKEIIVKAMSDQCRQKAEMTFHAIFPHNASRQNQTAYLH
jgi:hypothetical protein